MILNYRDWQKRTQILEAAEVELEPRVEADNWAEKASDVLGSYPDWKGWIGDFPSPTPAIELNLLPLANERFRENPGGWCWSGGKCYKKILVYRAGSRPAFFSYNWNWYPAEGRGEFLAGERLVQHIVIQAPDDADTLTLEETMDLVIRALLEAGVTDIRVAAAVLGVAGKESGLTPVSESIHTSKNIKKLKEWYPPLNKYSDSQIRGLQSDPDRFYEIVYGPNTSTGKRLGNIYPGDGEKYRGRGYCQVTGRSNYQLVGYAENPKLLLKPKHALIAMVRYYDKVSGILKKTYPKEVPLRNIVRDFVWATGGWSPGETSATAEGNFLKALNWISKHLVHSDGKSGNLTNRLEVPGFKPLDLVGGTIFG